MALVSIGLGANLGDRESNLRSAYSQVSAQAQITTLEVSRVYQTPPLGPSDQPNYLNAAMLIETDLNPEQLLVIVKAIESNMGRVTRRRWGERIIDLDILLYDDSSFDLPGLTIPH
ncbi:MAG: 2-amino-4-hydroxy-6-hydroxymethyldihydropteridine diphosphokinase, partial [Halieaceae bacterium MED-G27]